MRRALGEKERVRCGNGDLVHLDAEAWSGRHLEVAIDDLSRALGDSLPVLPDPVRVDRRDGTGRSGRLVTPVVEPALAV